MKNILIILLSFLLLAPPMQAHTDIVVFNEISKSHLEVENTHEIEQHKNDSEDEKKSEHHHHCHTVSLENIFITIEFIVNFHHFFETKEAILSIENLNYATYLDGIFQPPKNS